MGAKQPPKQSDFSLFDRWDAYVYAHQHRVNQILVLLTTACVAGLWLVGSQMSLPDLMRFFPPVISGERINEK